MKTRSLRHAVCALILMTLLISQPLALPCTGCTPECHEAAGSHAAPDPDSSATSSCCTPPALPPADDCCRESNLKCDRCMGSSDQNPALLSGSHAALVSIAVTSGNYSLRRTPADPSSSARDPLIDLTDTYLRCRVLRI